MRTVIIPLDSYTSAKKAVRYLASKGIRAQVEKISSGLFGCRFGIRTDEPPGKVCAMLAEVRIRCGNSIPVPPPPLPPPPPPPPPGMRPSRRGKR